VPAVGPPPAQAKADPLAPPFEELLIASGRPQNAPVSPRLILFDVDGVLLDSLGAHLAFCRTWAAEAGLALAIPTPSAFKALVRAGVIVSPMSAFFRAVGFPADRIAEAVSAYDAHFATLHPSRVFPDAAPVLRLLHERGVALGLVTANVRANVLPALGPALVSLLREDCIFTHDDPAHAGGKADMLREALRRTGFRAQETLFLGDQPADARAAAQAGVPFLAAAYGWGFDEQPGTLGHLAALPAVVL